MLKRFAFTLYLLSCAYPALAEPVFVNDALVVGLHQDNTLSSTIIELIPSGTELELLAREDNLLQVRTRTGITGWIDARYMSDIAPGRAQVTELEASLESSSERIAELEEKLGRAEQRAQDATDQASQAISAQPAQNQTPIPSTTLREMQTLAEENQRLKQQVAELDAVQVMAVERVQVAETERKLALEANLKTATKSPQDTKSDDSLRISNLKTWQLVLLGSALLLAFGIGGWLVDLSVRHRHGGHRI